MVIKFVQRSFDSLTMSGLHIGNDFEKSLSAIKIMIVFLFLLSLDHVMMADYQYLTDSWQ